MNAYFDGIWLVRLFYQRGLAAIYLVAFISALNQFRPLLGEHGLLPTPRFLERVSFREAPSVFHFRYSDRFFARVAWAGIGLSVLALSGFSDAGPLWLSLVVWLLLWALYLSIVNVGQTFYGFGWESMLVEAGFFGAFLGPTHLEPSILPVVMLRWMLFRTELGAGLIKIRHDKCWRDLTCLYYHHETQPLPNPLSIYFHRLPKPVHRAGVAFSHFVQLLAPFGLFGPALVSSFAGAFIILHQGMLIVSGNYAWLNWLTVVLGVMALCDRALGVVVPDSFIAGLAHGASPRPVWFEIVLWLLLGVTLVLSVKPTLNFFSKHQRMNYSYNPLHIVGSYGAFGSVTKIRYEVVLEGTSAERLTGSAEWKEYGLRAKPGDPMRRPPQVAPYHLRLDWLMWFLPFSVVVIKDRIVSQGQETWFLRLVEKLLEGDVRVQKLFRDNPFPERPPHLIRALFYRYEFVEPEQQAQSGAIWKRKLIGEYLPPVSLAEAG